MSEQQASPSGPDLGHPGRTSRPRRVVTDRGRRIKTVAMTEPQYAAVGAGVRLAQTLGAPEAAWVERVVPQPLTGTVVVLITHYGYPVVPWGAEGPRCAPGAAELGEVEAEEDWEAEDPAERG